MSCNISIPMEDIIEAVREELAKEFISIENGVGNNTTLNSPNIKGDVTFDSSARDALCSALAECVDEKLKALEDELDGKIEDTEAALRQAIADAKEDLEGDIDLLRKSFEDSQKQQDEAFNAKIAAQKELLEQAIAAGDEVLDTRIDGLDGKVDQQREDLEQAIEAGDKALDTRIDGLDGKVDHQREDLEKAIAAGDAALDTRIDGLDGKVDHQREDLENAIAAGDDALGARIDSLDNKVDHQREGLEKAIAAGDEVLDTRIDGLDGKVDQQREGLENAIAAGDDALGARIDGLDGKVDHQREDLEKAIAAGDNALGARIDTLEGMTGKITSVTRDADIVTIELIDGTKFPFSVKDNTHSGDRPVNFAPSANGDNIEITLADGSVLDMTRQEFAEWLAGKDSPITTDEELRSAIAAAADESDLQEQIDALQKQLDAINTDQATLEVKSGNLVLTNEDGSKSTIPLSSLAKVSAAAGNSAEVRADGIYVPTVQAGNNGFDKISSDANNIIVNKANGLYAPKTTIKGGGGVKITGKGTPEDPFVITGGGNVTAVEGYLPKDVGVSCDPAIQMTTAVKIDTIATWASPAVITSTKGDTYSHSLTAHGEYESEDSIQYIASLDIVSPKQINFTVFHPELNYRANYHNGHVYLDVGLRAGQTFEGNKEIVFDVTEGECDDNVVGWVDGEKIYGRDIESPKFGDGEAPGGNGAPFAVRNGHEIYAPIDFADVEFYNKAGEKVKFTMSRGIVSKAGPLGRHFFWYFAHSDRPEIVEALKVDSMYGYFYLPPDQIDFDKEVLITILFDRTDIIRVDMRYDGEEGEKYKSGTNHPALGNSFNAVWEHWLEGEGTLESSSYTKGKGDGAYYNISKNYRSTSTIGYPDNLTLLKYVGERESDKGQTVKLNPAEFKHHFVDNGIRFHSGGVISSSNSVYKDPRSAFSLRHPFYKEFPDQWFPKYPHTVAQAKKELTEMGFPVADLT